MSRERVYREGTSPNAESERPFREMAFSQLVEVYDMQNEIAGPCGKVYDTTLA